MGAIFNIRGLVVFSTRLGGEDHQPNPQVVIERLYLDSQVAGNHRPLYPKVDHHWFKVAHSYEPLALQVTALEPESLAGMDS